MKKVADLQDMMQRAGSTISSGLHGAGSNLQQWYGNMDPEAKKAILRGLIGAGIGGAATGGMAAATPHDSEEKRPVMGPALLGALLGGTAAAALPYGAKLIGGSTNLPGLKDRKPAGSKLVDALTYPASEHLGALGGLGAGYVLGPHNLKNLAAARRLMYGKLKHPLPMPGASRFAEAGRFLKDYGKALPKAFGPGQGRALKGLAGVPAGLLLGLLADKYMKGEY